MKKHRTDLLTGTLLLALAGFFVKIIGLFYKIPLTNILGDSGMGYFSSAYTVYTFFYMMLAAGLPVSVSLMVSEAYAIPDTAGAEAIYKTAMKLFMLPGAILSLLMLVFADGFSKIIGNSGSALSIAAVSPTLLFVSGISVLRGYFQGRGDMLPTALSLVTESVGKLALGLTFINLSHAGGGDTRSMSALAMLGLTLSTAIAFALLLFMKRKRYSVYQLSAVPKDKDSFKKYAKKILSLSLPVTVSASVMNMASVIDLITVVRRLSAFGINEENANILFGNYSSLALPVFAMPSVFITPIVSTFSPKIRECAFLNDKKEEVKHVNTAIYSALFVSLPMALGISAFPKEILMLIYKNGASVEMAYPLLRALSPGIVFLALLTVINSVLQALNKSSLPIISMCAGAAVKLAVSYFFIGKYGIIGASAGTVFCYLSACLLSAFFLARCTGYNIPLLRMSAPALASVSSVTVSFAIYKGPFHSGGRFSFFLTVCLCGVCYLLVTLILEFIRIVIKKTLYKTEGIIKYERKSKET